MDRQKLMRMTERSERMYLRGCGGHGQCPAGPHFTRPGLLWLYQKQGSPPPTNTAATTTTIIILTITNTITLTFITITTIIPAPMPTAPCTRFQCSQAPGRALGSL